MSVRKSNTVWRRKGHEPQPTANKAVNRSGGCRVFCLPAVLAAARLPWSLGMRLGLNATGRHLALIHGDCGQLIEHRLL